MNLSSYMDYLTHQESPAEFIKEAEGMRVVTPDGEVDLLILIRDHCLDNPELRKWNDAFVWQLISRYGDEAIVTSDDMLKDPEYQAFVASQANR